MFRKRLIGVVAAICALAAVTAAIAQGSGTTKGSSAKSKATTAHGAQASGSAPPGAMGGPDGDMHGPGGGAVHSVSVVPDKAGTSFITLTTDRGTVKSVDTAGATITIQEGTKSATYKTLTLSVPSGAKVMRDGKAPRLEKSRPKTTSRSAPRPKARRCSRWTPPSGLNTAPAEVDLQAWEARRPARKRQVPKRNRAPARRRAPERRRPNSRTGEQLERREVSGWVKQDPARDLSSFLFIN
jgi:hypothetical protein